MSYLNSYYVQVRLRRVCGRYQLTFFYRRRKPVRRSYRTLAEAEARREELRRSRKRQSDKQYDATRPARVSAPPEPPAPRCVVCHVAPRADGKIVCGACLPAGAQRVNLEVAA